MNNSIIESKISIRHLDFPKPNLPESLPNRTRFLFRIYYPSLYTISAIFQKRQRLSGNTFLFLPPNIITIILNTYVNVSPVGLVCTREMPNFRNNKFKKVVYLHKEASAQTYRTPNRINYRLSNTYSLKDWVNSCAAEG